MQTGDGMTREEQLKVVAGLDHKTAFGVIAFLLGGIEDILGVKGAAKLFALALQACDDHKVGDS